MILYLLYTLIYLERIAYHCCIYIILLQIHAYDRCKGKLDYKNCLHHACTEVRIKLLIFPQRKIFTVVFVNMHLIQHVAFRCVHRICRVSVHGIKSYFVGTSPWQAGKWNV
jgi:hypothetical protein